MAKKIFASLGAIVLSICLLIIGLFVYVKYYAPTKIVANSYNLGFQQIEDGSSKPFVEVKYFSNENKNGLECLELKFNYFSDENQTSFYSQGVQIVGNEISSNIEWSYYLDESSQYVSNTVGHFYNFNNCVTRYGYFGSYNINDDDVTIYNYSSENDFEDTNISTNPVNDESVFTVQLGEDLFLLKFKGTTTKYYSDDNLYGTKYAGANWLGNRVYNDYYYYLNVYSFSQRIYEALKGIDCGQRSNRIFEFGNMFDYYKYDPEEKQYTDTAVENSTKLVGLMKSYYCIQVEKIADGIQFSSESMFNIVQGIPTFNLNGAKDKTDYFVGKTVVECDLFDFNFVEMENDYCALKLSESFIENYSKIENPICLSICIDKDILKSKGIVDFVFADDCGLDKFDIFEIYSIETVDGQIVRTEVEL